MWIYALFAALALWTPDLSWEELERTYLRRPEDLRQVQGVRWHVRDDGTAQQGVWVLIHGFASDLQTWNAWAETLKATHRVIRVDLPGFGYARVSRAERSTWRPAIERYLGGREALRA